MNRPTSDLRQQIDHFLKRLRRQGQEFARLIQGVEEQLFFLDTASDRLGLDCRQAEWALYSCLAGNVQDLDDKRPIAELAPIVGVTAEHLHALAREGRLPVGEIDGERCASLSDARTARNRHPAVFEFERDTLLSKTPSRTGGATEEQLAALGAIRTTRASSSTIRPA